MRKRRKWQVDLLARGFRLGPFAYSEEIEKRLEQEVPLSQFATKMKDQLDPVGIELPIRALEWLYMIGLQARTERELVEFAKTIVHKKEWKTKTKKLERLVDLLREFPEFDLETILRDALGSKKRPKLRPIFGRLERELRELLRICTSWRDYANWGSLGPEYKSRLTFIDRQLRNGHSDILRNKQDRVQAIATTLRAIGLKEDAEEDNISRMLSRSRRKKRRTTQG
jgi:hypothetical protein